MTVARGALIGAVGGAALAASFAAGATMRHAQPAPGVTITARATPTPTSPSPDTPWAALATGDCLRDFASAWQQAYRVVACSERHAARVATVVALDGADRPSDEDLIGRLSLTCAADSSGDRVTYTWPSAAEWDAGIRVGLCFALPEAA